MTFRKLVPLSLSIVFVLFVVATQRVPTGNAQDGPPAPNAPLGSAFTYQGQLKDNTGEPIDDTCDFRFLLYDAKILGTQVGPTQDLTGVSVANGYFTVLLDFGQESFTGDARWLEVSVKCTEDPDFTSLSPRQSLTPAPYALNADMLDGEHATAFADAVHNHWGESWTGTATGLTLSGGETGLSGSGSGYGVYGTSSSTNGRGVYGHASSTSGASYGVSGESAATSGRGVNGYASATTGFNYGVNGVSDSTSGRGVFGSATAASGNTYGVGGVSASTTGRGVYGYASATSGFNYGVWGETSSPNGTGVYGYANETTGTGFAIGVEG